MKNLCALVIAAGFGIVTGCENKEITFGSQVKVKSDLKYGLYERITGISKVFRIPAGTRNTCDFDDRLYFPIKNNGFVDGHSNLILRHWQQVSLTHHDKYTSPVYFESGGMFASQWQVTPVFGSEKDTFNVSVELYRLVAEKSWH